jgi:hypothetical protein
MGAAQSPCGASADRPRTDAHHAYDFRRLWTAHLGRTIGVGHGSCEAAMANRHEGLGRELVVVIIWLGFGAAAASVAYQVFSRWLAGGIR